MEYVDEEMEPDPELNQSTNAIIGAAMAVHMALGPGFDESVYEEALAVEFAARGIMFFRQHPIQILYRDQVVGRGRLDFLVDNRVIVELKAVESIAPIHVAQVISYLRATRFQLAIIINFNVRLLKNGIKRVAL